MCVLAFLANCAFVGGAAGPRSPGPDVYLNPEDIIFLVDGSPNTQAVLGTSVTINVTVRNAGNQNTQKITVNITRDNSVLIAQLTINTPIEPDEWNYTQTVWDTSLGNLQPGDHTVNVTVSDLADDNLNNNTATTHFTILAVPKAHVFVDNITLPNNAMVGDQVNITAKLKNNGNKEQTDPDNVKFYVGTQFLPNGLVSYSVPLVADNVTSTEALYRWNTTQPGKFVITVEVVSTGYKLESHIINLTFPAPNVYITRIELDKTEIMQGESVSVTCKMRNNGSKAAQDEEIWFLIDDATSPSSTNYTVYKSVPKNDVEVSQLFSWNSTDSTPGNHTFTVKVPNSADVNASRTSGVLVVKPRTPKMAMTGFQVTPDKVNSGTPLLLNAVLENSGTADAFNQEVRFFLTSTDTYPLAIKKVNVKAGTASNVNYTYTPEIGENDTRMNFFAVFGTTVMNDSALVQSTVPLRPDLTVVSADFPTSMMKDAPYTVTAVIANIGKAPATNFTVKFNMGTELPYLIKNLDLANGQCMTVNWTLTPGIAGSKLKLKVDADATSSVAEANEFNNVFESDPVITVSGESAAFVEVQSVNPAQKSYSVATGAKASVKLTVTLQNKGARAGLIFLTVREGPTVLISDNVTVPANQTTTVTYKWNITGAKTHTAKVSIEGADAGLITSRIISVDLTETTPGFELVAVAAAIIAVVILVRKKRK